MTTMTVITLTAVHLYGRARSPDPWGVGTSTGLAGASMLVLSLPFLALATSLDVGCTDTGSAVRFDPGLDVVAAALTSSVLVWLLYLATGAPAGRAALWVTITLVGTSVAALFEFFYSWFEIEHHCNDLGDWRLGHLLAAVAVAVCTALVMGWRMQVRRRQA